MAKGIGRTALDMLHRVEKVQAVLNSTLGVEGNMFVYDRTDMRIMLELRDGAYCTDAPLILWESTPGGYPEVRIPRDEPAEGFILEVHTFSSPVSGVRKAFTSKDVNEIVAWLQLKGYGNER